MINLTLPSELASIKTRNDIDSIVKEYYNYISAKPFEVMAVKDKNRFDDEEEE